MIEYLSLAGVVAGTAATVTFGLLALHEKVGSRGAKLSNSKDDVAANDQLSQATEPVEVQTLRIKIASLTAELEQKQKQDLIKKALQ